MNVTEVTSTLARDVQFLLSMLRCPRSNKPTYSSQAPWGYPIALIVAAWALGSAHGAHGQTRVIQLGVMALAGVERGAGQAGSAVLAAPMQFELGARTWSDEFETLALGGSLRVEIDGSGGFAAVPRIEYRHSVAGAEVRPGLAFPIYFAPVTLLGPEVSLGFRTPLSDFLGLIANVSVTAYVAGNNLPRKTTLLQFNGGIGIDLQL